LTNNFARCFVIGGIVRIRMSNRYVGDKALTCKTPNVLCREIYDAKNNPDHSSFGFARRFGSTGRRGRGT